MKTKKYQTLQVPPYAHGITMMKAVFSNRPKSPRENSVLSVKRLISDIAWYRLVQT